MQTSDLVLVPGLAHRRRRRPSFVLAVPVLVAAAFIEVYATPGLLRSLAG